MDLYVLNQPFSPVHNGSGTILLNVEVRVLDLNHSDPRLRVTVCDWLFKRYSISWDGVEMPIPINQRLEPDMTLGPNVRLIRINEATDGRQLVHLSECKIDVHVYEAFSGSTDSGITPLTPTTETMEDVRSLRVIRLPADMLDDTWDQLVFEPRLQDKILTTLLRLVSIQHSAATDVRRTTLSRMPNLSLFLFWGPPGSGKTTLCRGLAQKLSIRLQKSYRQTKLVEIDAQSLYSKYFSESAKTVGAVIDSIYELVNGREGQLVIVLIDEIESLAGSRDQSLSGSEPQDALRAVNALLTGLDRLRPYPNLVVFCTSNLVRAMDPAFLDRVDFKWHVPSPVARARYEILRRRYHELIEIGWLVNGSAKSLNFTPEADNTLNATQKAMAVLPDFNEMIMHDGGISCHPAHVLWEVAQKSECLSGRSLQRLPVLSLAMHSIKQPCTIEEAMESLKRAVDDELTANMARGC